MEIFPAPVRPVATVHVPGLRGGGGSQNIACTWHGLDGRRMTLVSQARIPIAVVVSTEYENAMFLGEVISCTQDCDDRWHIEIEVDQILNGLADLLHLRAQLLGEFSRTASGVLVR